MPDRSKCPFYAAVPKDPRENALFRIKILDYANAVDAGGDIRVRRRRRQELWRVCARSPLFFINVFGWIFEPRAGEVMPLVTYDYQDDAILDMIESIECGKKRVRSDVCIMKSRDMGATWCAVYVCLWFWLFRNTHSFLFVSNKKENVDESGSDKSLFFKLTFILDGAQVPRMGLPRWLRPRFARVEMNLRNLDNGSVVKGEATQSNATVSDRVTCAFLDEFTANENQADIWGRSRDVTFCRIVNFTVRSEALTARDISEDPTVKQIRMHWTLHPLKAVGLYHDEKGKPRSPWYDMECAGLANRTMIRTELDMEWTGMSGPWFDKDIIDRELKRTRDPIAEFAVEVRGAAWKTATFIEQKGARFKVWIPIVNEKPPETRRFAIGLDVAAGTGATDSCLSVWDEQTGEKVADYADPGINPVDFADLAMAIGFWFGGPDGSGAKLKWEKHGPGVIFGEAVEQANYGNVYLQTDEEGYDHKVKMVPGWNASPNNKKRVFGRYAADLKNGKISNPSYRGIKELENFVHGRGGVPVHTRAQNHEQLSDAGENHGDMATADVLGYSMVRLSAAAAAKKPAETKPPYGSIAWIYARRKEQKRLDGQSTWRRSRRVA